MVSTLLDSEAAQILVPGVQDFDSIYSQSKIYNAIDELPVEPLIKAEVAQLGYEDKRARQALQIVEDYDKATFRHAARVAALANHIAKAAGFNAAELKTLAIAGLMHDLGKIAVDIDIIHPKTEASAQIIEDEWDVRRQALQTHPVVGYLMTKQLFGEQPKDPTLMKLVSQAVLTHHCYNHARPTYPNEVTLASLVQETGLVRAQLDDPFLQRLTKLLAVADVYEAVTANRTYTKDQDFEDPKVVEATLLAAHPDMEVSIDRLMQLHFKRFPRGIMPVVDWPNRGK